VAIAAVDLAALRRLALANRLELAERHAGYRMMPWQTPFVHGSMLQQSADCVHVWP
jgi:hypothetical protein